MNRNDTIAIRLYTDAVRFTAGLVSAEGGVRKFSGNVKREFESLKGVIGSVEGKLASLGVSVGVVASIVQSAKLDKNLTQIGQTAGVSKQEVSDLREEMFMWGKETGQGIEDLQAGFNNAVQSGLSFKEAVPVMDAVNKAMAVTGANANTLTSGLTVAATAFNFDLSKPGQALKMLDQMTVAGRLGNAELENLSDIFARVGPGAASAGMGFEKTLAFIEGLSQIEKQPERLATLADSTLRLFTNAAYMKDAAAATGVKFFNTDNSRRDPLEVLKDLKKQYDKLTDDKSRFKFMSQAFGKADLDTIKGLRTLLGTNVLDSISGKFTTDITGASDTLKRDMENALNNSVDQVGRLKNVLREAADGFATPINETLSNVIRWGLDKKENDGLALSGENIVMGGAALAIGTLATARYGGKALTALGDKFGLAGGLATGKALESAAGVTPVYVVNMPGGGINGGGLDIPAGLGKDALVKGASAASKFKVGAALLGGMDLAAIPSLGAGAMASAGLAVGAAGAAGYGVGTGISALGGWAAKGTRMEGFQTDYIGASIAKALSLFNIGESRMAVEINEKLKNTEIGGKISLEVTDKRIAVTAMKPSNPNVKMNVDAGHTMTGA